MLTTDLLSRSLAEIASRNFERSCTTRLLNALQPAPSVRYEGVNASVPVGHVNPTAHVGGINAMAVEKFEGRYLISGGADGQVSMWDLDSGSSDGHPITRCPIAVADKSLAGHKFGVTGLNFYPFDSFAFTSSSYDHTVKLFDSLTMAATASFDLNTVIYSHAVSPVAPHLLVACATQHPVVRLADLKTGAATHSLVGHSGGAILAVAWSPLEHHVLASGGSDGTIRLWDIRRSTGPLGVLDMDDAVGIAGHDGHRSIIRRRDRGKAHLGPVNGLTWAQNGRHLVSAGHDERVRVWDMATGANTLASFGPALHNSNLSSLPLALAPEHFVKSGEEVLFYPNEREIHMFDLYEGRLLKRLKPLGLRMRTVERLNQRHAQNRVLSLVWRHHNMEILSGHSDGVLLTWLPRTSADARADQSDDERSLGDEDSNDSQCVRKRRKANSLEDA